MEIYLKLLSASMVSVALSVIFYLLQKKTKFNNLPYWLTQGIIGICFGVAAIIGTEFGVNLGNATANARDAAPLCAGLLFGAPAGIIAGIISGVERWFAVLWGAGMYSRVACTVSTIIAGLYSAALRKFMFDNKRPTTLLGLAIGTVIEVFHMSVLFITHLSNSEQAYAIVKITTLPMIICNAASLAISIFIITLLSHEFHKHKKYEKKIKSIPQKVQSSMLICIIFAYVSTTAFVYILQTNTAINDATNLLQINISDVNNMVKSSADNAILKITREIKNKIENDPDISLDELAKQYKVSEINIVDEKGIITKSTNKNYYGFDFNSGEQSRAFLVLNESRKEFVQNFSNVTFDTKNDDIARKYAGCAFDDGGFVQVGYSRDEFHQNILESINDLSNNKHVGESGYFIFADKDTNIITSNGSTKESKLSNTGFDFENTNQNERYQSNIFNEDCFWMYSTFETYYIISVLPTAEVYAARDASTYINSFMEVLVFAILFSLIYLLIKKIVVNNIRSVNNDLKKIISGNLSITVDVHSSTEFSSLSEDINSTVTTLKRYIDEAAARIDKELEFARNIQTASLPSVFPAFPAIKEFDIYATMNTAKEVGGDFYDFYMIDASHLAFLIADVSGKGIPAAMFMMRAKTMLKTLAEEKLPVNEILTHANDKLCEGNDAGMFVTAWMGILDVNTGHISFANGGHNPPLIYRKNSGFEYLKSRPGLVLAGMEGIKYKIQELDLNKGDRIYLYTDGVTEATNSNDELYGEDRLINLLNNMSDPSPKEMLENVQLDIDKFVGEAIQFDDITMLTVFYNGKEDVKLTEKEFDATTDEFPNAAAFIEEELEKVNCPMKTSMQISVAFEELFVNIANYAYPDSIGKAKVGIAINDGKIIIQFTDSGIKYNPLEKTDPDITLSAEERNIGGLGIFMVKKTMDDIKYEYKDGQNILTIFKNL